MEWGLMITGLVAAGGWAAFGLLALRISALRSDRDAADLARLEQIEELAEAVAEHKRERAAWDAQRRDLLSEIEELSDDLEKCNDPAVLRDSINRLLSAAHSPSR